MGFPFQRQVVRKLQMGRLRPRPASRGLLPTHAPQTPPICPWAGYIRARQSWLGMSKTDLDLVGLCPVLSRQASWERCCPHFQVRGGGRCQGDPQCGTPGLSLAPPSPLGEPPFEEPRSQPRWQSTCLGHTVKHRTNHHQEPQNLEGRGLGF